jgi:hypothetical protein
LVEAAPGSLYGTDVIAFQQDNSLDEARDFLTSLVKSSQDNVLVSLCL